MKFKANILIITLFLLMMSSLSALLVTTYINNLIKLSSSFHDYYKSYYTANAGLELALVKTNGKVRGYGFEDVVASGSTTVTNNFSGSFNSTISSSDTSLGDANTSNPDSQDICDATNLTGMGYMIPPGGCVPIILLEDRVDMTAIGQTEGRIESVADSSLQVIGSFPIPAHYPNPTIYATTGFTALLTRVNSSLGFEQGRSKSFVASEEGTTTSSGMIQEYGSWKVNNIIQNLTAQSINDGSDRYILMIANTTSTTGHYCVQSSNPIPTQYVTISAQGTYRNTTLDLKGVRKAGLPADFCYTAISG